eukprot:CAMPEP_0172593054 /NCGR_PEP_ID=MMETSP1068-20121228/12246_1 /TAXON_ID=35684 /ORGANISM="Pseudopedinella elastica, Strain CCMP716" /LENGTH=115 /DNA_ID=CAMNT_0013390425 /DNA_START=465 /DNA_END=813 /DNA_ORIENTATION=+
MAKSCPTHRAVGQDENASDDVKHDFQGTKQAAARYGADKNSRKWNSSILQHAKDIKGHSSLGRIRLLGEDHAEANNLAQDQGVRVLHQFLAQFNEKDTTRKLALEKKLKRENAFT